MADSVYCLVVACGGWLTSRCRGSACWGYYWSVTCFRHVLSFIERQGELASFDEFSTLSNIQSWFASIWRYVAISKSQDIARLYVVSELSPDGKIDTRGPIAYFASSNIVSFFCGCRFFGNLQYDEYEIYIPSASLTTYQRGNFHARNLSELPAII